MRCGDGFPGRPSAPATLFVHPADLGARTFNFGLISRGAMGSGFLNWTVDGLSSAEQLSGDTLTLHRVLPGGPEFGPGLPRWWADETTVLEGTEVWLTLGYDTTAQSVAGELVMTDGDGREYRALIDGAPGGQEAELLRPRLREPGQQPLSAAGISAPALALRSIGLKLAHDRRHAEALEFLEAAAAGYAAEAAAAEAISASGGHAAVTALISAFGAGASSAHQALQAGDYAALLRAVTASVGYRRDLLRLAPHMEADLIAGGRGLPGQVETWRLRLDGDRDRMDALAAGTSFYATLVSFFLGLGADEDALVASELSRARAFADLLAGSAARARDPGGTSVTAAPEFGRRALRAALAEGARRVVEYFVTDDTIVAWVAGPGGELSCVTGAPGTAARLKDAVEHYQAATTVSDSDAEDDQTISDAELGTVLAELYALLWAPIAELLPSEPEEALIVVPQGSALLVPFPALRAPDGSYLAQRHAIAVLPALAMLPLLAEHRRATTAPSASRLLALLDPAPMPEDPDGRGKAFPAVPSLRQLGDALSDLYQECEVHSGPAASAATLLAAGLQPTAGQPSVVHLGTHAYTAQREGQDSLDAFVALASTDHDPASGRARTVADDGQLRARDLIGRPLPGHCVVLAACASGSGKVTSDGVDGLSRVFLAAGPCDLVLTLAQVDPVSSLNVTYDFHATLSAGASPALALAGAQRTAIADGEPARCWSPFVLFGLGA